MNRTSRALIFVSMCTLTCVSMWTTHQSLRDSILPETIVQIPIGANHVWNCSVVGLMLAVAIGLFLLALKLAIINEHKRLNWLGVVGLTMVAFISIVFNMDVLYRWADQDFFMQYSAARMKSTYEEYLIEVQGRLIEKRQEWQKGVAIQEAELESEIRGIRNDPAGYGPIAKSEDYQLAKMRKEAEVYLASIDEALLAKEKADQLLVTSMPETLDEIQETQDQLRVAVKDAGAVAGVPLPPVVKLDSPLFAVFHKLFDFSELGAKEILILLIALFIDLGDIVGYSLVPDESRGRRRTREAPLPKDRRPDFVERKRLPAPPEERADEAREQAASGGGSSTVTDSARAFARHSRRRRPVRFRRP